MNASEGLKRIATAARVLGWAPYGVAVIVSPWHRPSTFDEFTTILIFCGIPLGIAYGVAWIIDGFAKSKEPPLR